MFKSSRQSQVRTEEDVLGWRGQWLRLAGKPFFLPKPASDLGLRCKHACNELVGSQQSPIRLGVCLETARMSGTNQRLTHWVSARKASAVLVHAVRKLLPRPWGLSLQHFAMLCWWGAAPGDASVAAVCLGDEHRHVSPAGSQLGEWRNLPRTCICKLWCVAVPPWVVTTCVSQPPATV